tara:strand:+ start:364 stop:858 length:495 start_codon:yes stop_codon:yes gene_type:complete
MITINKKEEMEKYLVGNTYVIEDDVTININLNLKWMDLKGYNLECRDLRCWNLRCNDLNCSDLRCNDLVCNELRCLDLVCNDLRCWNLRCRDLVCNDLSYYAFAIAYNSFRCKTAKARRENGFHKCLDSEIEYIKDEPKETIKIGGVVFDKSEVGERLQGLDGL